MSDTAPKLAVAKYVKISSLTPGSNGHNLVAKVHSLQTVLDKQRDDGSHIKIAEAVLGDETGCVVLKAKNDQIDKLKVGQAVVIRNGSIEMYKGFMRLVVTIWGKISPHPDGIASTPEAPSTVKAENNLSAVEYVLVDVDNDTPAE